MKTPADLVSSFFSRLQAGQWASAVALIGSAEADAWRAKALADRQDKVQEDL